MMSQCSYWKILSVHSAVNGQQGYPTLLSWKVKPAKGEEITLCRRYRLPLISTDPTAMGLHFTFSFYILLCPFQNIYHRKTTQYGLPCSLESGSLSRQRREGRYAVPQIQLVFKVFKGRGEIQCLRYSLPQNSIDPTTVRLWDYILPFTFNIFL